MTWRVDLSGEVQNQLRRLDPVTRNRIERFMVERLATGDDPRRIGHALRGNRAGLWRYRIGDYRLICQIEDDRCRVLALAVGHRREVYRDH